MDRIGLVTLRAEVEDDLRAAAVAAAAASDRLRQGGASRPGAQACGRCLPSPARHGGCFFLMPFSMKSTDHHAPAHSFEVGIRETVAWYLENQLGLGAWTIHAQEN